MFTCVVLSGAFSTVFIFMVDVKKSQVECEEFVAAEIGYNVFGMSTM
jgi:hypothetical protein